MPPVWDSLDTINRLDLVEPGVTTKKEIINWFGDPKLEDPDGKWVVYIGKKSKGFLIIGGYGRAEGGLLHEKPWAVVIHFDEDSVVTRASTSVAEYAYLEKEQSWSTRAWDEKAKSILVKEAGIYCPNADLGHADAQNYVGDLYYFGAYGLEKNLIHAYVWYSLAAKNHSAYAAEKVKNLEEEMPNETLVEARRRIDQWQPGSCRQDLLDAASISAQ